MGKKKHGRHSRTRLVVAATAGLAAGFITALVLGIARHDPEFPLLRRLADPRQPEPETSEPDDPLSDQEFS